MFSDSLGKIFLKVDFKQLESSISEAAAESLRKLFLRRLLTA
jgi:hypothetical protein